MKKILFLTCLVIYKTIAIRLPHTFWPGGMVFSWMRKTMLLGMGCSIGRNCEIEPHVDIGFSPSIKIGDCCQINKYVVIRTVVIGSHVMIAPNVVFLDRFHNYDRTDVPMDSQGTSGRKMTLVGDDVWIGQGVIIMPGIKIGSGAIVGAGAVVTKDVPTYAVVAGVPSRILRYRNVESDAL